jgi:hypothetical protein
LGLIVFKKGGGKIFRRPQLSGSAVSTQAALFSSPCRAPKRICFVASRIVRNPVFNNQARIGAVEGKCRHAEALRASSDRRFDLTQVKPLHSSHGHEEQKIKRRFAEAAPPIR